MDHENDKFERNHPLTESQISAMIKRTMERRAILDLEIKKQEEELAKIKIQQNKCRKELAKVQFIPVVSVPIIFPLWFGILFHIL